MTFLNQQSRRPTIEYDFGPSLESINFDLSKTHIDSKQELNSLAYSLSIESIDLPSKQFDQVSTTDRSSNTSQLQKNNFESSSFRNRRLSLGIQTKEKKKIKQVIETAKEPVSMISMLKQKNMRVLKVSTDRPALTSRKNLKVSLRPKLFSTCISNSKENSADNEDLDLLRTKLTVSGMKNVTFPRISQRTCRMKVIRQNKKCKPKQEESSREKCVNGNSKIALQILKLKNLVC